MGRHSTDTQTVRSAFIIDINELKKNGLFKLGCSITAQMDWKKNEITSSILIKGNYRSLDNINVVLSYCIIKQDGTKSDQLYNVLIKAIPSNLGKGSIFYFLCPQTGKPCLKLYRAYNSDIWKSRSAYETRLYYPIQRRSKLDRYNARYFELERILEERRKQRASYSYNGKLTKQRIKTLLIYDQMDRLDHLRWSTANMPKSLQKTMGIINLNDLG